VYDEELRVSGITTATAATTIAYDGDGFRIKKTVGGDSTVYAGRLYECGPQGCIKHIFAGDQRIATIGQGRTIFFHSDHLGSTVLLTNEKGGVAAGFSYQPFGQKTDELPGAPMTAYLFTGKEMDSSTGLYYYGSRYYDPALGRFATPDMSTAALRLPQGLNRYSYAMNNPVTLVDPNGRFAWFVPIIVGAILGGTEAAIHHGNVLEGIARGAIVGGFAGAAGALAEGGGFGVQLAAQGAAGAGSGATNASIWGGDIGRGALLGAGFGAAGYALVPANVGVFDADSALGGEANYLLNSSVKGGFLGAAYGAATNQNIGEAAETGAIWGAAGAEFNSVVGHLVGVFATRQGPVWKNGAWFYEKPSFGGVTLGNVVAGSSAELDLMAMGGKASYNGWTHEVEGHIPQSEILGPSYYAVHGLSWLAGGVAGGFEFNNNTIHAYGFTERYWNSKPDY
jgi:RHS repeat-associated protein